MAQIIMFPYSGLMRESYEDGLKLTGKTYWVGLSPIESLKAIGEPFVAPELMFVDFSHIQNVGMLAVQDKRFKFLQEVPAVVISNIPISSYARHGLNVIGALRIEDQHEPESYIQFVQAFDQAKASNPGRPVEEKTFRHALRQTAG